MKLYKIQSPTTKQIFDAIVAREYVPIDKVQSKAKQIKVLLMNLFNTSEVLVTFKNVTNSGGYPIFLSANDSLYEIANEQNDDWFHLSDEEQDSEVELLGCYLRTYDSIFNL